MKVFNKKIVVAKIKYKDLLMHSSGKMGRHMDIVKTGVGEHKDKRKYDRKRDQQMIRQDKESHVLWSMSY